MALHVGRFLLPESNKRATINANNNILNYLCIFVSAGRRNRNTVANMTRYIEMYRLLGWTLESNQAFLVSE
jgi:hypothetical protein